MIRRSHHSRWILGLTLLIVALSPGPATAEEPFGYFRNDYNVIGLKDYESGTRVTPENTLLLAGKRTAVLRCGGQLTPLGRKTKTAADGWMPIMLIAAEESGVRYDFTLFATPLPTVDDWSKAFDWPTEGENFLNWVVVEMTNTGDKPAVAKVRIDVSGAAEPAGSFSQSLPPGGRAQTVARIPFTPVDDPSALADADAQLWLGRTKAYWQGVMAGAAMIEVPCRKSTEALRAAHVCQLIANDGGQLQGGEGFYDQFYIRDGGYQIMELEEAGLWDATEKAIESYLRSQREDGRFESQANQYDANGQAVWVLWQYYKITGDRKWLANVYPQMRRAVDWAMKARRQAPDDSPFAGVLPAAPADGEYLWDGKHHIVGYDIWNLRAMLCTADAARALDKTEEAGELLAEAKLYREAIDAAWKQTGLAHFPPSWEKAGTHWGNTETLWPTPLFASDDPRVAALIGHARNTLGGGFVEGTIRWMGRPDAIHPYMSAYTTMASLARGEHEQVVEDFYWTLLHSTAAHAFPEGIYYKRNFAWSNTIPHVTGASNYAILLRHMLLDERGDELHLLPAVPDWWLADGEEIRVQRAPTHFGPVSFTVRGTAEGVQVELHPPTRQTPKRIVLHLPKSRPLIGTVKGVEVSIRPDQEKRWDFPTVVDLYRQQAGGWMKPIPGLVKLPLSTQPAAEKCRPLDLTGVANTDPFTAPFGVPNPGKFLMTGLPTGRQTVGGIPFTIIDPKQNEGRGLVVLHSPRGPANRTWPKQVEIPVGATGRRLFFLGNVHGWSSHDPGTGPWGAVAQYVIHYADGQQQIVPLVTGRTIDEWALPPNADDVLVGPRGDPWHVNVLGVELRNVPIEKITFEDLGTLAAPVLVGVTLVQ
ncbi:MAG: hypothetical protein HQ581_10915 [Planctomycetes bacterium]|nr:hypothetical protein [Planctomycetota bacterium]